MQCFHKEAKLSGNSKVTNWTPESSKGQTVKMVLNDIIKFSKILDLKVFIKEICVDLTCFSEKEN